MTPDPDKRRKAHGEEIDTSNGALFLAIEALKREIKALKMDVATLKQQARDIPFRVGGSDV